MSNISYLSQMNKYDMYSSLLNSTYGSNRAANSFASAGSTEALADSLLGMYANIYSKGQTVTNEATASSDAAKYLKDVKTDANKLTDALDKLNKTGKDSLFDKLNASSSDTAAVTASYSGTENFKDITLSVEQLALAQVNSGKALSAEGKNLYSTGSRGFDITNADGKKTLISVSISAGDTNEDVQKKLADKINSSKTGVTASIEKDENKGTSRLVLKASETGKENGFQVSGTLATALGVNEVSKKGQDALYKVDGGATQSSASNTVKLDNGVSLTMKKTTEKDVTVKAQRNDVGAINGVRELVNSYNALMETAKDYKDTGSLRLANQLSGAAKTYASQLSKAGVSMNKNGYLTIDETKMNSAAQNGDLKKAFGNGEGSHQNFGFSGRLNQIAEKAQKDPENYISQTGQKASKNDGKETAETTASSQRYSSSTLSTGTHYINQYYKYAASAMLFDALI